MRRRVLRTVVVVVAAFGALFQSVGQDDLREFDAAYIQREMLKESSESLTAQRDQQAVYISRFAASSQGTSFATSAPVVPSQTLSAISTCILRC
jgi:hypothetical protein